MLINRKTVAIGIILLFVVTSIIPMTAQVSSSSQNQGNTATLEIEMNPPYVKITKPQRGWWYLFSFERKSPIHDLTFILGKINVTVNATDNESGVNRVEFYVDDILQWIDYSEPYFWIWSDKKPLFPYILTAVAYNNAGNKNSDAMNVWKLY